jgi:hypothetical protein
LPAKTTLLPYTLPLGPLAFTLTRKRCEDLLLLGAVIVGVVRLGSGWNEWALVGGRLECASRMLTMQNCPRW